MEGQEGIHQPGGNAPFFWAAAPIEKPPTYQVRIERNVRVPMRDGITLSADFYIPIKDGQPLAEKLPAVMQRTAYNKRAPSVEEMAAFFAGHGYLSILQDCRGRGLSEGQWFAFVNEATDGYDTIEWVAKHRLCNGKVGMYGCSHMGWTQLQAATLRPPSLATIIPFQGPTNGYRYCMHTGGTIHLGLLRWSLQTAGDSQEAKQNPWLFEGIKQMIGERSFLQWAARIPWKRGQTPISAIPAYEDSTFTLFLENLDYNDFWRQPGLGMDEHFGDYPEIPILLVTGWYDWYPRSLSDGHQKLVRMKRENQYLLIGPWVHNNFDRFCGEVNFDTGSDGVYSQQEYLNLQLSWFDRWMRNPDSAESCNGATVFIMGGGDGKKQQGRLNHGGRWKHFAAWPPADARPTHFYLHAGGRLSPTKPAGADSSTSYTYDPRNTVSSNTRCFIPYGPASQKDEAIMGGPHDQIEWETLPGHGTPGMPIASRPDVLIFQTDPLAADLEIAGDITLLLCMSSDAPDTDFFVRLLDVYPASADYPAGFAFPLTDGALRARYRNGFEQPQLMGPGSIYHLEIPLEPSANRFKAGHRIRVQICSSNFPAFNINRNTGEDDGHRWRIAVNTVWHDACHASGIVLPVRSGGCTD